MNVTWQSPTNATRLAIDYMNFLYHRANPRSSDTDIKRRIMDILNGPMQDALNAFDQSETIGAVLWYSDRVHALAANLKFDGTDFRFFADDLGSHPLIVTWDTVSFNRIPELDQLMLKWLWKDRLKTRFPTSDELDASIAIAAADPEQAIAFIDQMSTLFK